MKCSYLFSHYNRLIVTMMLTLSLFTAQKGYAESIITSENETVTGKIFFRGGVYSSPCTLDAASDGQVIDFGNVSARQFQRAGDTSAGVNVRLVFRDCFLGQASVDENVENAIRHRSGDVLYPDRNGTVKISFNGVSDSNDSSLLALSGVQGLGLRFSDLSGRKLLINQDNPSLALQQGDNIWEFTARLEATRKYVLANDFGAVLNVNLKYF